MHKHENGGQGITTGFWGARLVSSRSRHCCTNRFSCHSNKRQAWGGGAISRQQFLSTAIPALSVATSCKVPIWREIKCYEQIQTQETKQYWQWNCSWRTNDVFSSGVQVSGFNSYRYRHWSLISITSHMLCSFYREIVILLMKWQLYHWFTMAWSFGTSANSQCRDQYQK